MAWHGMAGQLWHGQPCHAQSCGPAPPVPLPCPAVPCHGGPCAVMPCYTDACPAHARPCPCPPMPMPSHAMPMPNNAASDHRCHAALKCMPSAACSTLTACSRVQRSGARRGREPPAAAAWHTCPSGAVPQLATCGEAHPRGDLPHSHAAAAMRACKTTAAPAPLLPMHAMACSCPVTQRPWRGTVAHQPSASEPQKAKPCSCSTAGLQIRHAWQYRVPPCPQLYLYSEAGEHVGLLHEGCVAPWQPPGVQWRTFPTPHGRAGMSCRAAVRNMPRHAMLCLATPNLYTPVHSPQTPSFPTTTWSSSCSSRRRMASQCTTTAGWTAHTASTSGGFTW